MPSVAHENCVRFAIEPLMPEPLAEPAATGDHTPPLIALHNIGHATTRVQPGHDRPVRCIHNRRLRRGPRATNAARGERSTRATQAPAPPPAAG